MEPDSLIELTAEIVAAYVSNNRVGAADISGLIGKVHMALQNMTSEEPAAEPLTPAAPVKRSVTADYVVCLEDGKRFKSLKRHLKTHGLGPAEYRAKWGLPADYPMVAPNYARARSDLARQMGLGQKAARR
jgi:predicted transcriptional regulator